MLSKTPSNGDFSTIRLQTPSPMRPVAVTYSPSPSVEVALAVVETERVAAARAVAGLGWSGAAEQQGAADPQQQQGRKRERASAATYPTCSDLSAAGEQLEEVDEVALVLRQLEGELPLELPLAAEEAEGTQRQAKRQRVAEPEAASGSGSGQGTAATRAMLGGKRARREPTSEEEMAAKRKRARQRTEAARWRATPAGRVQQEQLAAVEAVVARLKMQRIVVQALNVKLLAALWERQLAAAVQREVREWATIEADATNWMEMQQFQTLHSTTFDL